MTSISIETTNIFNVTREGDATSPLNPASRLIGEMTINGIRHIADLIQVGYRNDAGDLHTRHSPEDEIPDGYHLQGGVDEVTDGAFNEIARAITLDGHAATLFVDGREYFLVVYPGSR